MTTSGFKGLALSLVLSLSAASSVSAEMAGGVFPSAINPGLFVSVAESLAIHGVMKYYTVYGQYPATWSAVEDAGLCQVQLTRDGSHPLSLDDALNGAWDARYLYAGPQTPPTFQLAGAGGSADFSLEGTVLTTWQAVAGKQVEITSDPGNRAMGLRIRDNVDLQRLLALKGMLNQSIRLFMDIHGRPPLDWQELLAGGASVIDAASLNPLTGTSFHGDGRSTDFLYAYIDDSTYRLDLLDENAERYWTGSDL